jgi:hypothetical protein
VVSILVLSLGACGGDDRQTFPPTASDLSGEQGSISFCLQPQWGGADPNNADLVDLHATVWENRLRVFKNGAYLRFFLWPSDGTECGVSVEIDNWQPAQWHAVTVTFGPDPETGQNLASIYVDGSLVGQRPYRAPIEIPRGEPLYVGSNMPDTVLTSFKTYDRVLAPDEAASFAASCPH